MNKRKRYFFHVGFKGTQYRGWQRQKGVVTVQSVFEENLQKILKTQITCIGCGRTDAMVHAIQYFFHIDLRIDIDMNLQFVINKMLPDDMVVFDIIPVEDFPHAQFDATERTYDYFFHTSKDPFLSDLSALYPIENLDLDKMKKAVALLPKYNDYKAFCKSPLQHANTISNVSSARLFSNKNGQNIRFQITSDKFLKAMVRILVGKLLDIGTGKISVDEFEQDLINKKPPTYIYPSYPQGLYLSKVTYPFLNLAPRVEWFKNFDESEFWQEIK